MNQYKIVSQYLEERQHAIPVDLFPVANTGYGRFYSSIKLQEQYISIIEKSKLLAPVKDAVIKLVKNWIVVPCYTNKNIIATIINKAKLSFTKGGYVAFYDPKVNRVIAPFDTQTDILFGIDDKFICQVLFHELQHLASHHLKQNFYKLFSKIYNDWYSAYFNSFYKTTKFTTKYSGQVSKFLNQNMEWNIYPISKVFNSYQELLYRIADQLKLDGYVTQGFFRSLKDFIVDDKLFYNAVKSKKEPHFSFYISHIEAYKKLNAKIYSGLGQESFIPSEIASSLSEYKALPPHYKAIQMLSNLKIK